MSRAYSSVYVLGVRLCCLVPIRGEGALNCSLHAVCCSRRDDVCVCARVSECMFFFPFVFGRGQKAGERDERIKCSLAGCPVAVRTVMCTIDSTTLGESSTAACPMYLV